ncbi:MAG TPA: hypothetical protein VNY77_08195 [Candidatus Angelobacter sp.]|nr:hypothetical protein [Candidatus Angelobacter sp.]
MSQQPPPPPPGWSPTPPPAPPPRRDAFADFRGRKWWELVLIFLPITLIPIGGLLGGATGGAALALNLWIAKRSLETPIKVLVMVGVVVAAYVIFFTLATLLYVLVHPSGG